MEKQCETELKTSEILKPKGSEGADKDQGLQHEYRTALYAIRKQRPQFYLGTKRELLFPNNGYCLMGI